ncbi:MULTISPECIES: peptidoglycan D,D-transpeptidase FtsI family protein [unclassified Leifsonia]|uniref:peptidoglycan D,D-transpeptidase FtsI family protein n=1 Tax=unclassified Leifsonia TaxID=2663824 RepID=UPI00036618EC|nr:MULTISPECIES: penicillin-binding protein 2 [unclassified Leifsonia]TDP99718.1 cell division protein FtsI (penicillin-binding protein 3) [Leifsonia sp. 115AMFTsu3.1]
MVSKKMLRRRTAMTVLAVAATVGILGAKLVDIQVVRADALQKQSVTAKEVSTPLLGNRGDIIDSDGTVLATTIYTYTAAASPKDAIAGGRAKMVEAAAKIGAITGQGGDAVVALLDAALKENPKSQYVLIKAGMDVGTFDKLDKLPYPWLTFTKKQARSYPNGAVAGNLLGYLSQGGDAGLEASENGCLAGENGEETYQRGADGVAIPGSTVVQKEAKDGGTLKLTIDSDLQWFAQQTLAQQVAATGSKFGFVTVAEAKTGKIKAIAQVPSLDPNNIDATDPSFWRLQPLTDPREPGSTFKALTAAMLIDQGKATPTSQVLAPYSWQSGNGADLHDSGFHAPLRLTLTGVLMMSSNTGMSQLGRALSDQTRYDYLKKFGIGDPTGLPYPDESAGELHPVKDWDDQTKYATMFGQGVSATQLQMVGAYQALANGGTRIPLSLVEGCEHPDGSVTDIPDSKPTPVVSAQAAATTLGMMESVVTDGELKKQLQIPGYRIAAKTGTAQQPDGKGGYLPSYYVSVMGVAPVDDPQYVVSVNLGFPTTITSSAAAAPLFHTIMSQVLKTYRVKPSTSSPADYPPYY